MEQMKREFTLLEGVFAMAALEQTYFKYRKMNVQKLLFYGFSEASSGYFYSTVLLDGQFLMTIDVTQSGAVSTKVVDIASEEEYVLHRAPGACGVFVGMVRDAYETVLQDISKQCFDPDVFKSEQARQLIQYVRKAYGDELEFLWQKFPDNAVWRRKDTAKWYASLLTVSKSKLGIDSKEKVEILDLSIEPNELDTLIDNQRYFPGYHMNKKHWYTILLDGSVPLEELQARIDASYQLAIK